MATFYSPSALARHIKKRLSTNSSLIRTFHTEMVEQLLIEAQRKTSGGTSKATLAALGHPFGRKAGSHSKYNPVTKRWTTKWARRRGKLPVMPINVQSGRLRRGFKIRRQRKQGFGQILEMVNIAPYAKYILSPTGTSKMVTRPFRRDMDKEWRRKNKALLERLKALHKRRF